MTLWLLLINAVKIHAMMTIYRFQLQKCRRLSDGSPLQLRENLSFLTMKDMPDFTWKESGMSARSGVQGNA